MHSPATPTPNAERAQWMALLSRAPVELLERGLGDQASMQTDWLKPPETGLMMVRARAGGEGEKFNLGEATVTRCVLRLPASGERQPTVGVAYVLGRSHRQARLAALADALLQMPDAREDMQTRLLTPLRAHLTQRQQTLQAKAGDTKVDFFTMSREAGSAPDDDEDEE